MSIVRSIARHLFGKSWEVLDLEIAFHKQANPFGTHGVLLASHKDLKLDNQPVRFVFIGMTQPPAMTPRIIEYVWEEARAQGFIPYSIQSYGTVLSTHTGLPPRALVSESRRNSEDAFSVHRDKEPTALETTLKAIATASASDEIPLPGSESVPPIDSFLKERC